MIGGDWGGRIVDVDVEEVGEVQSADASTETRSSSAAVARVSVRSSTAPFSLPGPGMAFNSLDAAVSPPASSRSP